MSTKRPSISAFFPAYNDGGTIGSVAVTALTTLAELTDDYEVIVVENGSTDYTVEVLRELERQYDHFRALTHRAGSAADGHGTPRSFNSQAIPATLRRASRSANIHRTCGAVTG